MSDNVTMFGRSYQPVGNTASDLLLKTRGLIKLQIGNRFIDLVKDLKLAVDASFIFLEKPGVKDGIYVYDDKVILLIEGKEIPLSSETGATYVSFLDRQNTDSEAKHTALTNIGFLYDSLESVSETSLKNGIVYIEDILKLYIIKDGELTEFTVEFPSLIHTQFVIAKDGENSDGSLKIFGLGEENGIITDKIRIYSEDSGGIIKVFDKLTVAIDTDSIFEITSKGISSKVSISTPSVLSPNASRDAGYRLYMDNGVSILEIDKVILRDNTLEKTYIKFLPSYFFNHTNIIEHIEPEYVSEEETLSDESEGFKYVIDLVYPNQFKKDDLICTYITLPVSSEEPSEEETSEEIKEKEFVTTLAILKVIEANTTSITASSESMIDDIDGEFIFLISNCPLRLQKNNLDIVDYTDPKNPIVTTRIGDLGDGLYGISSNVAKYNADSDLSLEDDSTSFASTSWVRKIIAQELGK